ncbi:MAG: helix-turn-helix domain-containing protein [Anaerolineales bacterium]|jgi:predicted transcriptional regulator
MTEKPSPPEAILTLESLDALKVIADPLRNQILEVLTPKPLTINQVAAKLGVASSKLYYHFNLLEKNNIIRVVDTVVHGNLIEKHYWITAYQFQLDEEMFNFQVDTPEGTEQLVNLLLTNLNATREDIQRSMYARHHQISQGAPQNPRHVFDHREIFQVPDEVATKFHSRLHALVEEFKQEAEQYENSQEEGLTPWALSLVFYPSFYFEEQQTGEKDEE